MTGGQQWRAPAVTTEAWTQHGPGPVAVSLVSWWLVAWRARVTDESRGNVEARLAALGDALGQLDVVGGLPGIHLVGPSSVSCEFWFEAATAREAAGGARIALRQACKAVGVGDPTAGRDLSAVDVMLMFEEVPTLQRDDS